MRLTAWPLPARPGLYDERQRFVLSMSYYLSSEQCRALVQTGQLERRARFKIPKPPTDGATKARPGTEEKIAILGERFDRDEQVFHPGDLTVEQCKRNDAIAYGMAHNGRNGAEDNDLQCISVLCGSTP